MKAIANVALLILLLGIGPTVGVFVGAATEQAWVALLSGIALAVGVGLVLAIWVAGMVARASRVLLVAVFGPLLVLTNVALVPLIAFSGTVLTFALAHVLPLAALASGGATVLGVVAMANRALTLPIARPQKGLATGVLVTEAEQPRLWQVVREVAEKVGTRPPKNLLVGLELNFYASEQPAVLVGMPPSAAPVAPVAPVAPAAPAAPAAPVAPAAPAAPVAPAAGRSDRSDLLRANTGGATDADGSEAGEAGDRDDRGDAAHAVELVELKGRTVYVSLPFSRIMSVAELKAVLAHELGHFRGWDTRFSQVFYPLWRGATASLDELGEEMGDFFTSLPLLPAYSVLSFFLTSFAEAEARLSRVRELAADRESARATDARTAAAALVKIHGFARYWRRAQALLREQIARGAPESEMNAVQLFAEAAEENRRSPWMRKDLDDEEQPHPTDSHPPLSRRLKRLGVGMSEVADGDGSAGREGREGGAFTVRPEAPARALLERADELERVLTVGEKHRMIANHEVVEGSKKSW